MSASVPQPVRFLLVGSGGFLLNVCAFGVLLDLGLRYLVASILAYLLANAAMYVGNRYVTFAGSSARFLAAYGRFLAVGAVVAALTAVLLAAFVELAGTGPRAGQALALALLVPLSFALSQRWAFR